MELIGLLMIGYLTTLPLLYIIKWAFTHLSYLRPNYKGELIPSSAGIVFVLAAILGLIVLTISFPQLLSLPEAVLFISVMAAMSILGLIDDLFGDRAASGFRGHFQALLKGKITTGAVKALGGFMVALVASYIITAGFVDLTLSTLIIALSANLLNLLDLRPGRAGKIFLVTAAPLVLLAGKSEAILVLTLVIGSLLAYLPYDLKSRFMMGDTGSNALGAALGMGMVWSFGLPLKAIVLGLLIGLHFYTERRSLTQVIAAHPLLDYLDRLGR